MLPASYSIVLFNAISVDHHAGSVDQHAGAQNDVARQTQD